MVKVPRMQRIVGPLLGLNENESRRARSPTGDRHSGRRGSPRSVKIYHLNVGPVLFVVDLVEPCCGIVRDVSLCACVCLLVRRVRDSFFRRETDVSVVDVCVFRSHFVCRLQDASKKPSRKRVGILPAEEKLGHD